MCGIFAIFGKPCQNIFCNGNGIVQNGTDSIKKTESLRELGYRSSLKQRHRGLDNTGVVYIKQDNVVMIHERTRILGLLHGDQPLQSEDENYTLVANGEIYNYLEISKELEAFYKKSYEARSDCDVIIGLYEKYGEKFYEHMTGMYAFALYDRKNRRVICARDPIGIISMYIGEDLYGNLWVASEMKCLVEKCEKICTFPPGNFGNLNFFRTQHNFYFNANFSGHFFTHQLGEKIGWNSNFQRYYSPSWITEIPTNAVDLKSLREKLEHSVLTHLKCDCRFGVFLSGGVDSSLIASIATKIMHKKNPKFKLKSYSVGLKGAPDFKYSRMVADYIQSEHHEITFDIEQGLDCIREIIYHLETYDVTTIRASIPMYLLTRYIRNDGLKMVLSGEGADEIFGGYLYFHQAPNEKEFHEETVSRVLNLSYSDCLRANKSTLSWSVELRVPFLDTEFIDYAMSIRPEDRMITSKSKKIEKFILRQAFTDGYLPDEVLWRQKEQFSDGVGYGWIDTIRSYASSHVTDEEFSMASKLYPFNTPLSKEGFYYRRIFEKMFPHQSCVKTVKQWIPRRDWGCSEDPSGRAQSVHVAHK